MVQHITRVIQDSLSKMIRVEGKGGVRLMVLKSQGWVPIVQGDQQEPDRGIGEQLVEEIFQEWCEETSKGKK